MTKRILVLDPSTSHLAYVYIDLEGKIAKIHKTGMLWTKDKWNLAQKLDYMFDALMVLLEEDLEQFHTEAYFVGFSKNKVMGVSAIPTLNNIFRMLVYRKTGEDLLSEIPPTQWRKVLGIKPETVKGKRDYKEPTKKAVEKILGTMPETVMSNQTGKERALPHDITDALAIGLAICKNLGYTEFSIKKDAFNANELKERLDK